MQAGDTVRRLLRMKSHAAVPAAADPSHDHRASERGREVDYLEVVGHARFDVHANGTRLILAVDAGALVADDSALSRVEELRALCDALKERGGEVRLLAVEGRAKSGLLGSSTEARYTLEAAAPTSELAAIMIAIAKDKHADLVRSSWSYPDVDTRIDDAAADATRRAKRRAERLAEALDAPLGPPHCVLLDHHAEDESPSPVVRKSKSASMEDSRIRLASRRTIHVQVTLRYALRP